MSRRPATLGRGACCVALTLALDACALPLRSLDPNLAIPQEERFELLREGGLEVFTSATRRRPPSFLEATFVARADGGSDPRRLTSFEVRAWIDVDGNGVCDEGERSRFERTTEPSGMQGVVLQLVTPYEPQHPTLFQLEATYGGVALVRTGRLAQ